MNAPSFVCKHGYLYCSECEAAKPTGCDYAYHHSDVAALGYCPACVVKEMDKHPVDMWGLPMTGNKTTKCECGAEKTGYTNLHAHYCPKWSKV